MLEPHRAALRSRQPLTAWRERLADTFGARVRGPVFEEMARDWTRRFAEPDSLGGLAHHIGPSVVRTDGNEFQLDVVAAGAGDVPGERAVLAIGEAKAGERIGVRHLRRLEGVRGTLGARATGAKLLFFGNAFTDALLRTARKRDDVEIVGLERMYGES